MGGTLLLLPTSSGRIAALVPYEGPYGLNFSSVAATDEGFGFGFDTRVGTEELGDSESILTEGVRESGGEGASVVGVEGVGDGGGNCSWCFLTIGSTISSCV